MNCLDEIKKEKRWVCVNLTKRNGKITEKFISPITKEKASATNPYHWDTYDNCLNFAEENKLYGVGIILTKNDNIICISLENSISEDSILDAEALKILGIVRSYTEKSINKKSINIFLKYNNENKLKTIEKENFNIKAYTSNKIITFTNAPIINLDILEKTKEINDLFKITDFYEEIKKDNNDHIKFNQLYNGETMSYDYNYIKAGEELIRIIAKYANTPEECYKIFYESTLYDNDNELDFVVNKGKLQLIVEKIFNKKKKEYDKIFSHTENLNNYEMCLLFFIKYGDTFIYNKENGVNYYYNGMYYVADTEEFYKRLIDYIYEFANKSNWSENAKEKIKNKYVDIKVSKKILETYRTMPNISKTNSDFNENNNLLCCKNGVINLETGELLSFSKKYLITKCININYKPNISIQDSVFEKYINEATSNSLEKIKYLQILAGYCLTGETDEQSIYFLYGKGQTGKSIFVETLKYILGSYAVTVPGDCFSLSSSKNETTLATCAEARLVLCSEESSSNTMNTSLVKQTTGQEKMVGRKLFNMPFEFTPNFKIIISTNEMPQMKSDVGSMKRRLKIIPFDNVVPDDKKDKHLFKKLKKEKEIILYWAVMGAIEYYKNGFPTPSFIEETRDEVFEEQDIFFDWVNKYFDKDTSSYITTEDLWQSYSSYCIKENIPNPFKDKENFSKELKKKDYVTFKRKPNSRGYYGLKLKNEINNSYLPLMTGFLQ